MTKLRLLFLGLILLLGFDAHDAVAQDIFADAIPQGAREGTELREERRTGEFAAQTQPGYKFVFAPSYASTAFVTAYSAALGFHNDSAIPTWPFQFYVSGKRLDVGRDWRTSLGAELKVTLFPKWQFASLAAKAGYVRTFDVSSRQEYLLTGDRTIIPGSAPLNLGGTISFINSDPDHASSTSGWKTATGLTWKILSATALKADYTLKTGISTEDDYSFALQQGLFDLPYSPTIKLLAGKHRLVAVTIIAIMFSR